MKRRKFASGGYYPDVAPTETNDTASSGLDQINKGSNSVGSALGRVSNSLQTAQGAIGNNTTPSYNGTPEDVMGSLNKLGVGMKKGGSVSKASSRADGIAQRGKTRGKMC